MKKRISTRVLSAFLAVVMVFLMVPFSAITAFAEESVSVNAGYSFSASIKYQTEYRINNRYTTIYNTFNKPEQKTKWQNFTEGIGKAKGIVGTTGNLAVNLYTQIMGWDSSKKWYENTGKIALNLACSYFGIQLPGPSESDKTIEAVGKMIEGVHDHLYDMENNIITELSDVVRDSDADLAAFISTTAKEAEWRTYLDAFYGKGSNFNYDAFRGNLNDAINLLNTAYDLYDEAVQEGNNALILEREGQIKTAYDNLYNTLTYTISGGNYSPINEMRSKMTVGFSTEVNNEETICSLPKILYAYKVVNASNEGMKDTTIAESCIGFALDIYNTYLLAEQCLNACYAYQLNDMQQNDRHSYTASFNTLNCQIYDSMIKDGIETSVNTQKEVTDKLVADIAFLLNLESSYTYQIGESGEIFNIHYIEQVSEGDFLAENFPDYYGAFTTDDWCRINNDVSNGDIIYLNLMPEMFAEMFKDGDFTFDIQQFDSSNKEITAISNVTNTGVVNILGNVGEKIRVAMCYNGVECYHMDFDIVERSYDGGMGINACPYLISSKVQLEDITKSNASFRLVSDIDFKGATIDPLGTLTGVLDGNGYSIYGFKIDMNESQVGLFNSISDGAKIQNLTIGHESINYFDGKSVYISSSNNDTTDGSKYCGVLAGINNGTIENCLILNTKVNLYHYWHGDNTLYGYAGGIVAQNNKTIENCDVSNSEINGEVKTKKDTDPSKCYAYVGGIVGINADNGSINSCSSLNNSIYGYTNSKGDGINYYKLGRAYTYCGGIAGKSVKQVTNCFAYALSIDGDADYISTVEWFGTKKGGEGEFLKSIYVAIGKTDALNCIEQNQNCTYEVSCITMIEYIADQEVEHIPSKTYYCVGESLNLGGLIVYDNNGNTINGYTISDYNSNQAGLKEIQITYVTGYGTKKDAFTITVDEVQAAELLLFSKPANTTYKLNASTLDVDGLMLLVRYNNGTSKILSNGENGDSKEYVQTFDFSTVGKSTVTFEYEGLTATMDIDVVCYHNNAIPVEAINATCNDVGYTAGTYCDDCETYISGHEEIPVLSSHPYGNWTNFSNTQHSRSCTCGEVEYADHAWNDGVVTTEPTHLTSGEKTYTCTECTATKTEKIPPIEGHTFSKWTKHDDAQHVRSCECGETEYADHDWGDGTITTPATYEQDGVRTYTCLDCDATYTVAIPKPVSIHLFIVDDASAVPGGTMQVNVRLENNPGIAMMRLKISYDSSVLTLDQVTYNTDIGGTATQPTISDGTVILLWYNESENVEGDWIFATLTFTVKETATVGSVSDIILTYDAEEICDIEENNVVFSIDNGSATVLDHVPGDINGDDGLTSKDLLRLARYFAGWDVEVNENALDINGDGEVNSKDLLRLARYVAGWDVEIY